MLDPLKFQLEHHMADLVPGRMLLPPEVKKAVFDIPRKHRLNHSRLLENLYLVAVGVRPSSMFHPESIEEIVQVHEIASEIGIGMVVRKCGKQVYKVFLFSRRKQELASRIPDVYESMGFNEFILAQITIANLTGDLLEFPICCREFFIEHLMKGTDQDQLAHDRLRQDRKPDPRAYFVERFVPCDPHCDKAVMEGERIQRKLHALDADLEKMYEDLRKDHMNDIRDGVILKEKRKRDELMALAGKKVR